MLEVSKSVISKEGKYLLLKRADHSRNFPSLWDFAGGKDDLGETPKESVVRETLEETCFEIDSGEEIKTKEFHDETRDIIFHYFIPKIISGELKLSSDHSEYGWFSLGEMEKLDLHPAVSLYF